MKGHYNTSSVLTILAAAEVGFVKKNHESNLRKTKLMLMNSVLLVGICRKMDLGRMLIEFKSTHRWLAEGKGMKISGRANFWKITEGKVARRKINN